MCYNIYIFHVPATHSSLQQEILQAKPFASPAQEATLSIGRTWALLEHALAELLKTHGLTPTQYNALRILRGPGEAGLCRGEVMERMITTVPDATRLLDRLEHAGLISRRRDGTDRRFVSTHITGKGRALLAALDVPVDALHRAHFAPLADDDLRTLIDLLARVRDAM
jgi:DNA-binding MarR family transcriptional regulator